MTQPNDRILNWIGPDGVDYDYTGTRPDASYMNDIVDTELGRMTIREYLETVKRKYAKDAINSAGVGQAIILNTNERSK